MAKKFGKFLLFAAALGGAAAAAYYYFQKKDVDGDISEDEDYDDFSEDLDGETETDKKYVSLTPEGDTSAEEAKKDSFVPLDKVAQPAGETGTEDGKASDAEVEEFFDEEDASGDKA